MPNSCKNMPKNCRIFPQKQKNPLKLLQRRNQACILHIDTYISARNNAICGQNSGNLNKIGWLGNILMPIPKSCSSNPHNTNDRPLNGIGTFFLSDISLVLLLAIKLFFDTSLVLVLSWYQIVESYQIVVIFDTRVHTNIDNQSRNLCTTPILVKTSIPDFMEIPNQMATYTYSLLNRY